MQAQAPQGLHGPGSQRDKNQKEQKGHLDLAVSGKGHLYSLIHSSPGSVSENPYTLLITAPRVGRPDQ